MTGATKPDGSRVRTDEGIKGHFQRGQAHQQRRHRRGWGNGYFEVDVTVPHDRDHASGARVQRVAGLGGDVLSARERHAVAHAHRVEYRESAALDQRLRHRPGLLVVVENAPLDAELVPREEYDILRKLRGAGGGTHKRG